MISNRIMPVTLREFTDWIEELIPLSYQETYDNSGLQVGDPDAPVSSVLLTLDVTEAVIREAIRGKHDLVISHHPVIFTPLKQLAYASDSEMCVAEAIKNGISIYSAHTNFDNISWGVSHIMAKKIGLGGIRVIKPAEKKLSKLVTFVPEAHLENVRNAIFAAGAGNIGEYDCCSFNSEGIGTFRPGEKTNPFVGTVGKLHSEKEVRIEAVVQTHLAETVVKALLAAHPYEEVAYDIIPLENKYQGAGAGAIGTLATPLRGDDLLQLLREVFGTPVIRYSGDPSCTVTTVAVCGGAGSSLIGEAVRAGAEAFITGDIKYHAFSESRGKMLIADVGHYESEIFSLELLRDLIKKKFPKFALRFSGINTNPINYF